MVKKLEDNDVLNINETNSLNNGTANGLASSYADSLKSNLKRKQHQTNLDSSNSSSEQFNSSTNDFNGNGLLNELVVSVTTNLPNNISKQKSTNSINHIDKEATEFNNQHDLDPLTSIKRNSATELDNSTSTDKFDKVDKKSFNISKSPTTIVSTLSTKRPENHTQIINSNENMELDCLRSKIDIRILKDDLDHIEVSIPIKHISKDTFKINFQDQSLSFKFKTTDTSFLRKHSVNIDQYSTSITTLRITNNKINGSSADGNRFNRLKPELDKNKLPYFNFKIKTLFDKIIPQDCSYAIFENELKVKLKKKIQIKWNGLEHVKREMCVDYLNGPLKIKKEDDFRLKNQNKNSNVERLVNGFEKSINTRSFKDVVKKEEEKEKKTQEISQDQGDDWPEETNAKIKANDDWPDETDAKIKANDDWPDESDATAKANDAIPLPPPMPSVERTIINDSNNEADSTKDAESLQNLFGGLLTNPILSYKNDLDKETESLSDDQEPKQPATFRLNLAELKNQRIGYTGLNNLGNTCYMNSCLQCLSSTLELRDYFLTGEYKDDLNPNNPFGSGGKLAEAFNELLYNLWSGKSSSFSPQQFKRLIDVNCSQFMGYSQHDSVEFMEHFLDVLHEDLNRVDRKNVQPATAIENEDKLSDEELANEQWKRHKERNDSIITELFYGQYKSKLVCPQCSKVSLTFDPFLYLPIPLTKNTVNYTFYLFTQDDNQPKRLTCKLPQGSKILSILEHVTSKTEIGRRHLIPCLIKENGGLDLELRNHSYIPDDIGTRLKKLFIFQKPENELELQKFIVHQTVHEEFIRSHVISYLDKCEYCNKQLQRVPRESILWCKCNKVAYCKESCLQEDFELHKKNCKIDDSNRTLVGWPSIFYRSLDLVTYEEFMDGLEKQALNSIQINETQVDEEEEEDKEIANNDVHVGHEIKEGQLELDSESKAQNLTPSKANNEEETTEESDEKDDQMQIDEPEEIKTENSDSNDSNSVEKNEDKEEEETIIDSGFRFILRGKENDLNSEKDTIYIPKDDSEAEQKKFRDCIRKYYYLYVDWKEKYSKLDEDGNRKTFKLSIQSKELIYTAKSFDNSSYFSSSDQERKADCTLDDLMTKFTEPETLSTQEAWVCPNCKEPRTASKELTIWKPPKILVIQLKRFSYSSYLREKIDKLVQYPVKGLDISKYCSNSEFLKENKPIYDLYAIIDHYGGLYGGHYTANANSSVNGKSLGWRVFNDSSVRSIGEESPISHSAYVLFYRLNDSAENKTD